MLLKKMTELDVLKIENAITIKHEEIIAKAKPIVPTINGTETPGMTIANTLGMYAVIVARSSPIFAITFGAMKNTPNIVAV
jgi:hypothetical protein